LQMHVFFFLMLIFVVMIRFFSLSITYNSATSFFFCFFFLDCSESRATG
jgi:hypothetical protein